LKSCLISDIVPRHFEKLIKWNGTICQFCREFLPRNDFKSSAKAKNLYVIKDYFMIPYFFNLSIKQKLLDICGHLDRTLMIIKKTMI
jgi:hypothetical protein